MRSKPTSRDPLLDLWRGIALIDMAWVHLAAYPIGMPALAAAWVGEYGRFAAGCFVLLSGATVRTVFGPGLGAGGVRARDARRRLWRRALLLAFVDRITCVSFGVIEHLALRSPAASAGLPDETLDLLLFRTAGVTGGLLVLYSFLLLATPLLEWLRQRTGAAVVLAASLVVFAGAQVVGEAAHWPPWTFPLAHWQPLFVIGYLAAPAFDRLRAADGTVSWQSRLVVTAACAALFLLRSGPALGVAIAEVADLRFVKVPLNPGELLWYVVSTAFVLVWSAWAYETGIRARRRGAWLVRLGQWSLLAYVAHLLLEPVIVAIVTRTDPPPLARAASLPAMALALACVALLAERVKAWRSASVERSPAAFRPYLLPPAGITGVGVALASVVCVVLLRLGDPVSDVGPIGPDRSIDGLLTMDDSEAVPEFMPVVVDPDVDLVDGGDFSEEERSVTEH